MVEEKKAVKMPHNVIMEDRKSLTVSGVSNVDSFDEQTVIAFTEMGELAIKGQNLQVSKLSTETGELFVTGKISALIYTEQQQRSGGFFSKVFR